MVAQASVVMQFLDIATAKRPKLGLLPWETPWMNTVLSNQSSSMSLLPHLKDPSNEQAWDPRFLMEALRDFPEDEAEVVVSPVLRSKSVHDDVGSAWTLVAKTVSYTHLTLPTIYSV